MSLAASDSTHSTSIFPQASTSNLDLVTPAPQQQPLQDVPPSSNTVFKLDAPPKRSDSLRKRTQSTPLRTPPQPREPLPNGTPTSTSSNKKSKVEQPPRSRAVTGNLNSATRKPTSSSPNPANGRKPLQPSSNRQVSTPIRKGTSPSPSTASSSRPIRSRSHSATLLSSPDYSYDAEAKPPWLEEQEHLYKSDLTSPAPGSLAHIAMHAQGQNSSPSHAGDKSWDDVIIPTVAKQIRAQQALNASTGSSSMEPSPSKQSTSALTDEGDLLVTDWYPDGTPKKWKRVGKAQRERMLKEQQGSGDAKNSSSIAISATEESRMQGAEVPHDGASAVTEQPVDQEVEVPQANDPPPEHLLPNSAPFTRNTFEIGSPQTVQLSRPPPPSSTHSDSRSATSIIAPPRSRTNTNTGRTEIWQEPGLTSPNVAKTTHGFGTQQMQAARNDNLLSVSKEQQYLPPKKEQQNMHDDGTHKGGCRCIIM